MLSGGSSMRRSCAWGGIQAHALMAVKQDWGGIEGRLQQELDDAAGMHRWQAAADAAGHSQLQASGAGVQQEQAWVLGSGCSGQPC